MGYYDTGAYGGYDPLQERETARDRYLDLLARQRMSSQAMVDKMRREEEQATKDASAQAAGDYAARAGQTTFGLTKNPIAAVVATVIGKGIGAFQHGKKYGAGEGFKAFVNPISTPKAMIGMGGGEAADTAGRMVAQREDERRIEDLLAAQNRPQAGAAYSSYEGAADMGGGQKLGDFKFKDDEDEYAFG